jgi:hypothetical protein
MFSANNSVFRQPWVILLVAALFMFVVYQLSKG